MITHQRSVAPEEIDPSHIRRVLMERGFREMQSNGSRLRFQRGSVFRTMLAFNPSKWRNDVYVDTESGSFRLDVSTTGQLVLENERTFVDALAAELFDAMLGVENTSDAMVKHNGESALELADSATSRNLKIAAFAFPLSVVGSFAVVSLLLGNILFAAGGFGAVFLMLVAGAMLFGGDSNDGDRPTRHYD